MKAQLAVSKVYTALAGSKEQSSGIASQVQNSTQTQGQDSPQIPCTWSSVLYTALRNRGEKKEKWTQKTRNEQTKNLPLSSHAFLKCSPRQSPEWMQPEHTVIYVTAQPHLTWQGGTALTQPLFVHWIFNAPSWWSPRGAGFPPMLQGSKGFCLLPHAGIHESHWDLRHKRHLS